LQQHLFVSYASEDDVTARAIVDHLEGVGLRCWVSYRDIAPGTNYAEAIVEAINQCFALLLVHSVAANESPHVVREVERAVSEERPVVPLKLDIAQLSKALAYLTAGCQWLDSTVGTLPASFPVLVKTLRALREQQSGQIDHDANLNATTRALFQLRIVSGPNAGEIHLLNIERMVIGRSQTSDIYLSDQLLSRMVGAVTWDAEAAVHELFDFGSREGFTVNGVPLPSGFRRRLEPGDEITLGASKLIYEVATDAIMSAGSAGADGAR